MLMFLKKLFIKFPLGLVFRVKNKDQYRTANPYYYAVKVRVGNRSNHLLLTEHEFNIGLDRALRNKEDLM